MGRLNFLKKDQVRLAVSDDGVEAAQVCPLVCVEAYDREERGNLGRGALLYELRRWCRSP